MSTLLISPRNKTRGFTLLELLIVIAILGLIALGVVLASQRMTASAAVSAARSERQMLQKAVDAMMAEAKVSTIDPVPNPPGWNGGEVGTVKVVVGGTTYDAGEYVRKAPGKGKYTVDSDGIVRCFYYPGVTDYTKVNP